MTKPASAAKALPTRSQPFPKAVEAAKQDVAAVLQNLPPAQRKRIADNVARADGRTNGINMKLSMDKGNLEAAFTHPDTETAALALMADMATMDSAFFHGVIGDVARIGARGAKVDEDASNFLLSVVRAVQPRDELETMLAIQMGAVHAATMTMARRLNRADTIPLQDATERAFTRLARTFTMQLEALNRHRAGGQQKVVVEHVTVNAGGQAIVGNVTHGGEGAK